MAQNMRFQVAPYEASDNDFMKCYLDCGAPLDRGMSRTPAQYQCWTGCRLDKAERDMSDLETEEELDARTQHIEGAHHLSASERAELEKELSTLSEDASLTAAEHAELEALKRELSGTHGGRRKRKTRRKRHRKRKKTKNRRRRKRGGNGLEALIATKQIQTIADRIIIKWVSAQAHLESRINTLDNTKLKKLVKNVSKEVVNAMGGVAGANARYRKILMSKDYLDMHSIKAIIQKLGVNRILARQAIAKVDDGDGGASGGSDGGTGVLNVHMTDTDPEALRAQLDALDMPIAPTGTPVAQQQKQAEAARKVAIAISDTPHQNGGRHHKTRKKRGGAPRLGHELATPAELNERGITWADGTHADVYIAPRDITSDGKHKVVSVGFALAVEKKLSDLAAAINDCYPVGCRKRDKEATAIQAAYRGDRLRKDPPEVLKIHQQFKPGGSGMVEASSRWDSTVGNKRKRTKGGHKTRRRRRKSRRKRKTRRRRK